MHIDEELTVNGLAALVRKVMQTPAYRENAQHFQKMLAGQSGPDLAADVVEAALAAALDAEMVSVA